MKAGHINPLYGPSLLNFLIGCRVGCSHVKLREDDHCAKQDRQGFETREMSMDV